MQKSLGWHQVGVSGLVYFRALPVAAPEASTQNAPREIQLRVSGRICFSALSVESFGASTQNASRGYQVGAKAPSVSVEPVGAST